MASWMVHLRIADKLLSQIKDLSDTEFIVGNIAPDSGVPNSDGSAYMPPAEVSHFCGNPKDIKGTISPDEFLGKYVRGKQLTKKENSFYMGYYVHLLTDILWNERVYHTVKDKFYSDFSGDRASFIWTVKGDWYDLDHLFLKKNPKFRAFCIYEKAKGFRNIYMEEFSEDAFARRQEYITGFYRSEHKNLDREYKYLTEQEMVLFVETAVQEILIQLESLNEINS